MTVMVRRILMSLLILCLAAPALALPVIGQGQTSVATAHHGEEHHTPPGGSMPDQGTSQAKHECIGCIAPVAAIAAPGRPLVFVEPRRRPVIDYRTPDATDGPETPPPQF